MSTPTQDWTDQPPGEDEPTNGHRPRLRAVAASTYTPRAPRWLWDMRIPQSGITLLAGREGIGKSSIDATLAAWITRGRMPGLHEGTPRAVGVVATEDAWEEMIVPRLMAAGADLCRVFNIEPNIEERDFGTISLPADTHHLPELCKEHGIAALILDPIMSLIHGSLDTHNERQARQALDPLASFARTEQVAVIANIHVNKTTTNDSLNSVMASKAFTAVARSVLYCLVDPDSERGDRYLLGHAKCNIGPKQAVLQYHLVTAKIEHEAEVIPTSRVVIDGDDSRSLDMIMESRDQRRPGPASSAATKIKSYLQNLSHPASIREIHEDLPEINYKTLTGQLRTLTDRGELVQPTGAEKIYSYPRPLLLSSSSSSSEVIPVTQATSEEESLDSEVAEALPARARARERSKEDPPLIDWTADEPEPPEVEDPFESPGDERTNRLGAWRDPLNVDRPDQW